VLASHETSNLEALISVLAGVGCLLMAVFCDKFYWARGLHGSLSDKQAPTWAGRLLFSVVGSALIIFGLLHLYFAK
jgi:hypothetical protein